MKIRESGMAVQQRCRCRLLSRLFLQWISASPFSTADDTGSEIVEFGLLILPLIAVVFMIMDVSWICFAHESLQNAVQGGVRSAITGYLPPGSPGFDGYIKSVVQQNAMGFLSGSDGLSKIKICYYSPSNLNTCLAGAGSDAGGNIIDVSIQGATVSLLGPVLIDSAASVSISADSSDVMEGSPNGIPPPR